MKGYLVICDSEITYAKRLSEYLSSDCFEGYEVRLYTSVELLKDSIKDNEIDILIIDEKSYEALTCDGEDSGVKYKRVVVLSPDKDSDYIYKYQSAKVLKTYIFDDSKNVRPGHITHKEKEKDIKLRVKEKVQNKLLINGEGSDNETLKTIDEFIESEDGVLSASEKNDIRNKVFYSIRGLDVLEELISDESITEIMVNSENMIFYEKNGKLLNSYKCFDSKKQLLDIIRKIVSDANRTVNVSSPIVDARLKNGSRVNVVLEPVSINGPTLTIRRFPKNPITAEKLIMTGSISEEIVNFLRKAVFAGYNIIISGSTGSGKTSFLNILTSFIPKDERIITIEDSAELKIMGIENLVRLESRNATSDGTNEITIRDLIKAALRMRPDRIIVGEVRGDESIDMIQSFTVGQEGSMSTIHANSAEDALYRLEMLMMLGKIEMPLAAIRRQISIGVDLIVHLGRLKSGERKLLEICEVTGMDGDSIATNTLYKYKGNEFIKLSDMKNTYKLEKACIL